MSCPISHESTADSLAQQLKNTRCKALFTSGPLLDTSILAAALAGIPRRHIYVLGLPDKAAKGIQTPKDLKTVDQLIEEGKKVDSLPEPQWSAGRGIEKTAFLCSSSGTTGFPVSGKFYLATKAQTMLARADSDGTRTRNKSESVTTTLL